MRKKSTLGIEALLLVVFLSGCGGGGATAKTIVSGKLVKNGSPLSVRGQEIRVGRIEIHFISPASTQPPRIAQVQPDGRFALDGELPPGTYRLAIYALEPPADPSKASPAMGGLVDQLEGAFSKDNTPIEREISAGADLGEIDLANFPSKPTKK